MRLRMTSGFVSLAAAVAFCSGAWAATITVDVETDGTGDAGDCELQDAILAANNNVAVDGCAAGSGDDRIVFNASVANIVLNANLPEITENLEIAGRGKDVLTIDGNQSFRQFKSTGLPTGAARVTIRDIELKDGHSTEIGGCILLQNFDFVLLEDVLVNGCESQTNGGGASILSSVSDSEAIIRRSTFENNTTELSNGALNIGVDVAQIEDSTFNNNTAPNTGRRGGAVGVGLSTILTITRSTFWGNSASGGGTAITTASASPNITIRHSTLTQNSCTGTSAAHACGAIYNSARMSLENTVVALNLESNPNHDQADVVNASGTLVTAGHNFIGQNDGAAAVFPAGQQPNGDVAGTSGAPLDPQLGTLMPNGGITSTALPQPTSPLIDQGSCPGEEFDQRGFGNAATNLRPVLAGGVTPADDGCDIGAVEAFSVRITPLFKHGFETP